MAFGQQGGGNFERKMVSGNWNCSKCNAPITELPFEPDPNRLNQLLCRDCHRARKDNFKRDRF